jgi:hypothetical protein
MIQALRKLAARPALTPVAPNMLGGDPRDFQPTATQ